MKTIKLSLLNYRTVLVYTVILSLVKKTLVRLGLRLLQQAVKLLRQKPLMNIPSKFLCLTYSQNGGGPDLGQLHCKLVEGYRKIQGGKRVEKTSGGGFNYTRKLDQLSQSRQKQDRAVQLPL